MKKIKIIILSLLLVFGMGLIIFGVVNLVASESGNHSAKTVTSVSEAQTQQEAESEKVTQPPTEIPTREVETVSSSDLTASQQKQMINDYDYLLGSYGFEGMVYVSEHGKPVYKKGIGYADKKKKIKNNEYTLFRVASVTKQFTAAAILLLQERGKLSIKDKLGKYFPEYKNGAKITLENVMRMQGGIPDYMNFYSNVAQVFPDYKKALKNTSKQNREIIKKSFMEDPILFEQGKSFKYSNSGYLLLGEIIEKVSGTTYENFIKTEIFDKLGMKYSGFIEDLDDNASNVAQPYNYKKGALDVFKIKGAVYACGNMYSNVIDLTKWADGLRKGKIISKESLNMMIADTKHIGYGFGLFLIKGEKTVFHSGLLAPFNSLLMFSFDSSQYSCVVLSNSDFYACQTLAKTMRAQHAAYLD